MHLIFFFESIHLNSSKFIFKKLLKKEEEEETEAKFYITPRYEESFRRKRRSALSFEQRTIG